MSSGPKIQDPTSLMTVGQVAEFLQIDRSTVRRWLCQGCLRGLKLRGEWRIEPHALEFFLEAHANRPTMTVVATLH